MDAQRGLSVSGHRNTVLCLHLTSDTYHVTPSGRAPRARGKFWIRRVKLRIFRPDPKSHKSEGFPAAQIFKTHKCQNTYCRSAHFSKAVKFVGAQNPRGTTCTPSPAPTQLPPLERPAELSTCPMGRRPSQCSWPWRESCSPAACGTSSCGSTDGHTRARLDAAESPGRWGKCNPPQHSLMIGPPVQ